MAASARKRDPAATRRRILQAAGDLLARGEGTLEMSWVAKAAGVSQGLAYHHFGSKEGMLAAVIDDFYDRIEASVLLARLDDIGDWEARERQRVQRYLDFLLEDPLGRVVIGRLAHTPAVATVESKRWERLVTVGPEPARVAVDVEEGLLHHVHGIEGQVEPVEVAGNDGQEQPVVELIEQPEGERASRGAIDLHEPGRETVPETLVLVPLRPRIQVLHVVELRGQAGEGRVLGAPVELLQRRGEVLRKGRGQ